MSKENRKYLWLLFLVPLIAYGVYTAIRENHELAKYGRYTIGTTVSFYSSAKGGKHIWYEYEVNEIKYKGSSLYQHDAIVPDGRYYVRFSQINPNISEIYLDKPVPKHIKTAPAGGFDVH